MGPYDLKSLIVMFVKHFLRRLLLVVPEGKFKFQIRAVIAGMKSNISPEFLANPGGTVVLVGFHRIDSVMLWSYLVGSEGKVLLIEAVPEYVENIRINLGHHLKWPLKNISFVNKGVDSVPGKKYIQIGKVASANKLAGQDINDGLSESDYTREIEIETDIIDNILSDNDMHTVNHIEMTISGMEVEALKGMKQTLMMKGLSIQIQSGHLRNGQQLFPQVAKILEESGMKTVICKKRSNSTSRDVYACRLD